MGLHTRHSSSSTQSKAGRGHLGRGGSVGGGRTSCQVGRWRRGRSRRGFDPVQSSGSHGDVHMLLLKHLVNSGRLLGHVLRRKLVTGTLFTRAGGRSRMIHGHDVVVHARVNARRVVDKVVHLLTRVGGVVRLEKRGGKLKKKEREMGKRAPRSSVGFLTRPKALFEEKKVCHTCVNKSCGVQTFFCWCAPHGHHSHCSDGKHAQKGVPVCITGLGTALLWGSYALFLGPPCLPRRIHSYNALFPFFFLKH
jgi:hypothetical protein